jgi:hypothetical protein
MKYQLLCQRIMNCCFYAAVFPEVLLFTIFGLALDYWIEKWWLLGHCCIPKFSSRLASVIVHLPTRRIEYPSSSLRCTCWATWPTC